MERHGQFWEQISLLFVIFRYRYSSPIIFCFPSIKELVSNLCSIRLWFWKWTMCCSPVYNDNRINAVSAEVRGRRRHRGGGGLLKTVISSGEGGGGVPTSTLFIIPYLSLSYIVFTIRLRAGGGEYVTMSPTPIHGYATSRVLTSFTHPSYNCLYLYRWCLYEWLVETWFWFISDKFNLWRDDGARCQE